MTSNNRFKLLAHTMIAAAIMFLVNVALASNHHYDANATTGGLQKVCTEFKIDAQDILSAKCNKLTAGVVSQVSASVDLKPDTDTNCRGTSHYIEVRENGVINHFKCPPSTGDKNFKVDLNDMVTWNATEGTLTLKNA